MILHRTILVAIITVIITIMASITVYEQQVEASRDGFDDGKEAGQNDRESGRAFNDDCYDDNGLYCFAYKSGYRVGYEMANFLD